MQKFTYDELNSIFKISDSISAKESFQALKYHLGLHTILLLKSETGLPLFVIKCEQFNLTQFFELSLASFNFQKANVTIDDLKEKPCFLISPSKPENVEIFIRFIEFLIPNLVSKNGNPVDITYLSLIRWKKFWNASVGDVLSEEKVQGLWGEIYYLDFLISNDKKFDIVNWTGSSSEPHDFEMLNYSIEVKTTCTSPAQVKISGLQQLNTLNGKVLFLAVLELRKDSTNGINLVSLIDHVETLLSIDQSRQFWSKLIHVGYRLEHQSVYEEYKYKILHNNVFKVAESFPRITPDTLSAGADARLKNVSYILLLEDLNNYIVKDFKL